MQNDVSCETYDDAFASGCFDDAQQTVASGSFLSIYMALSHGIDVEEHQARTLFHGCLPSLTTKPKWMGENLLLSENLLLQHKRQRHNMDVGTSATSCGDHGCIQ